MHALPFFIFLGIISGSFAYYTSCRHKERMELIKQGEYHRLNKANMSSKTGNAALFLGLLFSGIGIALMISNILFLDLDSDMSTVSIIVIFASASMLLYWKMTAKDREESRRIFAEQDCLFTTNKKTGTPAEKEKLIKRSCNVIEKIL